jgi:Domain of unknown function (DUF4390)
MRMTTLAALVLGGVLALASNSPVRAELRISDLDVYLNDHEVTVHIVLLGAIPTEFLEGLHSGISAHLRVVIELFRYNRLRPDRRVNRAILERTLTYNVVTKEYKVTLGPNEHRPPTTTRELRHAERILSEARGVKLTPADTLDASEIYYVRVNAETALNGDTSWVARMSGLSERTSRQSDYRTLLPTR